MLKKEFILGGAGSGKTARLMSEAMSRIDTRIAYLGSNDRYKDFCSEWFRRYGKRCPIEFAEGGCTYETLVTDDLQDDIENIPMQVLRCAVTEDFEVVWFASINTDSCKISV